MSLGHYSPEYYSGGVARRFLLDNTRCVGAAGDLTTRSRPVWRRPAGHIPKGGETCSIWTLRQRARVTPRRLGRSLRRAGTDTIDSALTCTFLLPPNAVLDHLKTMDGIGTQDDLRKFCDVVGVESGAICPGSFMVRREPRPAAASRFVHQDEPYHWSRLFLRVPPSPPRSPRRRRATRRTNRTTARTPGGFRRTSAARRAPAEVQAGESFPHASLC